MSFNILEVCLDADGETLLLLGTAQKSMWVLYNPPASGRKACEPAGFVGPESIQGAITGKLSVATDKSTGGPCSIYPIPTLWARVALRGVCSDVTWTARAVEPGPPPCARIDPAPSQGGQGLATWRSTCSK